jgi:6-pyruvoyltetrahydropterin/6-carboxytetrahydropterin synthase
MLSLTKIFHFEMAHAIHGYPGACKNIHGHSYELHVKVTAGTSSQDYIPAPGFIIDFKELKHLVSSAIIKTFDHKLVLSGSYLDINPAIKLQENLLVWQMEPTAENLLLYIVKTLRARFPEHIKLLQLKLYETKDSYAEWANDEMSIN